MSFDHPPRDSIVLTSLRKSYEAVHAVRGIDLFVGPGETVSAPSGRTGPASQRLLT